MSMLYSSRQFRGWKGRLRHSSHSVRSKVVWPALRFVRPLFTYDVVSSSSRVDMGASCLYGTPENRALRIATNRHTRCSTTSPIRLRVFTFV